MPFDYIGASLQVTAQGMQDSSGKTPLDEAIERASDDDDREGLINYLINLYPQLVRDGGRYLRLGRKIVSQLQLKDRRLADSLRILLAEPAVLNGEARLMLMLALMDLGFPPTIAALNADRELRREYTGEWLTLISANESFVNVKRAFVEAAGDELLDSEHLIPRLEGIRRKFGNRLYEFISAVAPKLSPKDQGKVSQAIRLMYGLELDQERESTSDTYRKNIQKEHHSSSPADLSRELPEPKNLVICCDGTGNEISENISNVLKLYRCLRKTDKTRPRQKVFYDPGVGTVTEPSTWHRWKANVNLVLGLATGYGLDDNTLSAYCFLVQHYAPGDRIYLFGFSRGAYTVRVLAGLIHKIGLISPEQANLAGSGLVAYKQYSGTGRGNDVSDLIDEGFDDNGPLPKNKFDLAAQFARITSSRWPTIHFIGVWDTVASVIVPRADRLYLPSFEELAFTLRNPSVNIFRQAIAIDERRCMFRLKQYDEPQDYWRNRFVPDDKKEPQDILQVWFAGVHCDVGGGYPEAESGESKYPLLWMIEEATKAGLNFNPRTVNQLAWGVQRTNSPFQYVPPAYTGKTGELHDSMTALWRVLEYLPKSATYKEWPERKVFLGLYIPDCEPRPIPEGAHVHESVVKRMAVEPDYRPVNLPKDYVTVPMPLPPHVGMAAEAGEIVVG